MLTLSFDTKNGNRVYVGEKPSLKQNILSWLVALAIMVQFFAVIFLSMSLGSLLGSFFNDTLAGIMAIVFGVIGFIVAIVIAAFLGHIIRHKIVTTYGYMTYSDDTLEFIFSQKDKAPIITELKDTTVVSEEFENGVKISIQTQTNKMNLANLLAGTDDIFSPLTRDAGNKQFSGGGSWGPTDTMLAAWLGVDLYKKGSKISPDESNYIF